MFLESNSPPFHPELFAADPVRGATGVKGVVTADAWHWVRIACVSGFVFFYFRWFRDHGIVVDPISVLVSICLLLFVAHIGRPLYRWRQLVIDLSCYAVMWIGYNETYGLAGRLGRPRQVESVRNIDRALFLGTDPNVWMQKHFYDAAHVRWYDVVASIVYFTHFVVPATVLVSLWINNRRQWMRFMRRFATVLAIACITFVVIPTVPPWLAGEGGYHALPTLARPVSRGWQHIGLNIFSHAWDTGKDFSNPLAAMPSLHAALSLFTVVFFLPSIRRRWLKIAAFAFPLAMALSLVYLGEHYVSDILAGWLVVGFSFYVWNRIELRMRLRHSLAYRAGHQDSSASVPSVVSEGLPRRRRVFVDASLVNAEVNSGDADHLVASGILERLVDEYEQGTTVLFSHGGVASTVPSPEGQEIMEMCQVSRLRRDLRRAARKVLGRHPDLHLDLDQAMTLVLMRRNRITEIATFDPLYRSLDIPTVAAEASRSATTIVPGARLPPGPGRTDIVSAVSFSPHVEQRTSGAQR